jgi:hypothetical protein
MAQENTAPVTPISQPKSLSLHESIIEGRIQDVEQPENSDFRYYEFALPARDEYSLPAIIQVSQPQGARPLGRAGDLLRIRVAISGFPRRAGGRKYITNVLTYIETL